MAVKEIGIIFNGATGRIGSTQHLANALAPIRAEGGLPWAPTASCRGCCWSGVTARGSRRSAQDHGIDPTGPPISMRR